MRKISREKRVSQVKVSVKKKTLESKTEEVIDEKTEKVCVDLQNS